MCDDLLNMAHLSIFNGHVRSPCWLWPRFSPDSVHEPMAQGVGQITRAYLLHLGIEIGQLGAKQLEFLVSVS